ncbi:MAG: ribose 5-phosphate isomerase B [Armatimonadota bacterium]|nr:ribose 5-phosphate isomerase B [Armatimonadota bacterium]
MRVALASDHAGYPLKESLRESLKPTGCILQDFGTFSREPVDYPDIACRVAEAVASGEYDFGVLVCGTGIGMSIAANKIPGIRAAACSDTYSARMARAHNNANILCLGSRVVGEGLAYDIAMVFLATSFESHSRHEKRVEKIAALERRMRT